MTRQEKNDIVAHLATQLTNTPFFYIVDASGLNVEEINDFRRKCFQVGVTYQVVKNTLIGKALEKLSGTVDHAAFQSEILKGFSGILFAQEVGNVPAKLIKEFRKGNNKEKPLLKGAYIDSELFVGEVHLEALSNLKSKAELIGEVIGLLQVPVDNVMAALQSGKHQLAGAIQALAEREDNK